MVQHWCRLACRIVGLRRNITGTAAPEARFLVANHVSWLDIVALAAERPCLFLAKAEVANWPVIGALARGIDTLFVRRGEAGQTAAVAERMLWQLRRGRCVLLFPEGTTTAGDRLLRFHSKLFEPAERAGAVVQPIALSYTGVARDVAPFIGEDEFLPHLLQVLRRDRIELDLAYCPPLPADQPRAALAAARSGSA